ncbi:MAG: (d)CMP kinase [Oscillospiraceae bacterium]|nr:(d)CMP kinase [Candidatus Limimonas egerieequi]
MINIAIDGPGGAGKSTIARAVAAELGFIYVDTGALYRAVGLNALRHGIDTRNIDGIVKMLDETDVSLSFIDGEQRVMLNGEDVSTAIRLPEASMAASNVSAIPAVRQFLFDLQRKIAEENNCLMDGRDIGSVVLPNADLKLFMTASPETRAQRRFDELKAKGEDVKYSEILDELNKRDYQDSHREIAPLKQAEDAILFDTSDLSFDEVKNKLIEMVKEKIDG